MYPNSTSHPTFFSTTETLAASKIICLEFMYPMHILLCYGLVATGIGAMVSRLVESWKPYHVHFGRAFMGIMYFAIASSILIHNSGMPRSILFFFVVMLFSLTIGWGAIRIRAPRLEAQITARADAIWKESMSAKNSSPSEIIAQARSDVLNAPRTWRQRFFSLKSLHGYLMALAWYQMAGRAGVTNPFTSWSGCHTFPASKSLGPNGEIQLLPVIDPKFGFNGDGVETRFAALVTVGALVVITLVGVTCSCLAARKSGPPAVPRTTELIVSMKEVSAMIDEATSPILSQVGSPQV